jgi:probable F420-dependent oxidoreductase
MKLGIVFINAGARSGASILSLARRAEEAGVESVWTGEHVMIPVEYDSPYPYNDSGRMGVPPETNLVDPLITLAAVAAATSRVRLGTGVNILPQSNPLLLAKQAASLDFISNGRLMLGLGIGWLKEEFDAMGVPFERRGARFDDYVQAMRKVWSGEVVEHRSEFLNWSNFKSYPLPVQRPLPIVIGGDKGKAFERIARYGNGWYTPRPSLDEVRDGMARIAEQCRAIGRDPAEIEITAMWHMAAGLDTVRRYRDAGVHRMLVPMMGNPDAALDALAEAIVRL